MTEVDRTIINDFKSNSNKGVKSLLANYGKRTFWTIRSKVPNHADADDIMQNVLMKVVSGIGSFKGESGLFTWIHRIAYNETINYLKKENKYSVQENIELVQETVSDTHSDPDIIIALLSQAIKTLPERQRQVFIMRYYEELKYEEISKILNLSEGALKASYHLAVKKIEDYVTNR